MLFWNPEINITTTTTTTTTDPINPIVLVTRKQLRDAGVTLDEYNRLQGADTPPAQVDLNAPINVDRMAEEQDQAVLAIQSLSKHFNALTSRLDNYDGAKNVNDWLSDFTRYCTDIGRETDNEKLNCFIAHLTGEARAWFRLQAADATVVQLVAGLKLRFEPTVQQLHSKKMQLYAKRQQAGQPFAEFVREVQEIARGLQMPEVELVRIALSGANPNIRAHLAMAQPDTISKLLKLPVVTEENLLPEASNYLDVNMIVQKLDTMQTEMRRGRQHVRMASPGPRHQSKSPRGNSDAIWKLGLFWTFSARD